MLLHRPRNVIGRQCFVRTVVFVSIPRIKRHLEIVDHHDRLWTSAEDDFELLGEGKINVPMRIEIEEEYGILDGAERPGEQPT